MGPQPKSDIFRTRAHATETVADCLAGGDSLLAWSAVWDLIQSGDSQGKADLLEALRAYVANHVGDGSDESVRHARQFQQAIAQTMLPSELKPQLVQSQEVRDQLQQDQAAARRKAMDRIGMTPGEGVPMWMLYMTRRSKRSWKH